MTPLKEPTDKFTIAQGNLAVGGFGVEGKDGSSLSVNIPTVDQLQMELQLKKWLIHHLSKTKISL